jgi:hypothetical protein
VLQEPVHAPAEAGQALDDVVVEQLHRHQRDQAHQRADLQRDGVAVDQDLIVIETVVLVPQPVPPRAFMASTMATKCSKNFEATSS